MEPIPHAEKIETSDLSKSKKRKNIAKDIKERFGVLIRHQSAPPPSSSSSSSSSVFHPHSSGLHSYVKDSKLSPEVVSAWLQSFDSLLHNKVGLELFREFLRTEFSDENLEFWISCETYKNISADLRPSHAQKLFGDFIAIQAPREINLDSKTRDSTCLRITQPDEKTFEEAQHRIQALMEKDSYPRFLRSEYFKNWLAQSKIKIQPVNK